MCINFSIFRVYSLGVVLRGRICNKSTVSIHLSPVDGEGGKRNVLEPILVGRFLCQHSSPE